MANVAVFVALVVLCGIAAAQAPSDTTCLQGRSKCVQVLASGGVIEDCETLIIPPREQAPFFIIPPEKGYRLEVPRTGVFAILDGAYNWVIALGTNRVMVIDAPPSFIVFDQTTNTTRNLLVAALDEVLGIFNGTVANADIVYSHEHLDHIGAATSVYNYFQSKYPNATLTVHMGARAAAQLRKTGTNQVPMPDNLFTQSFQKFDMSPNLVIQCRLGLGPHSEQDLLVYMPPENGEQGVVMLIDVFAPGWGPFFELTITADPVDYLRIHSQILSLPWATFIGGHLTRLGTRADVELNRNLTTDLIAAGMLGNQNAVAPPSNGIADPTSPDFLNVWKLLASTNEVAENICINEVFAKYACVIAAFDSTVRSHCRLLTVEAGVVDFEAVLLAEINEPE